MSMNNKISLCIVAIVMLLHAPLASAPTFGLYDLNLDAAQRPCRSNQIHNHPYRHQLAACHQYLPGQQKHEHPPLLVRQIPMTPPGHNPQRNVAGRRRNLHAPVPGTRLSDLRDLPPPTSLDQIGTFQDPAYLADLAIMYHDQALLAQPQDPLLSDMYQARANACQLAADNPEVICHLKPTEISPSVLKLFPDFAPFEGTIAQLHLHRELAAHCEEALYQQATYQSTDTLSGLSPMVLQLSADALASADPMVGFHLANACYHLLNAGKYLAKIGRGIGKGTLNFAEHAIEFLKQCVQHPLDTTKEVALQSIKAAGLALGAALILSIENPTALEREAQFALVDKATDLLKAARRDPEKAAEVITELLLTQASITKGCQFAGRNLRHLKNSRAMSCIVDDVRAAYLRLTGKPVPIPAGVDIAAYDASLASYQNVLKHDPAAMKMAEELAAKSSQPAAAGRLAKEQALADPIAEAQKTALARTVEYQEQILVEGRKLYNSPDKAPPINKQHLHGEFSKDQRGKIKLTGCHLHEINVPGATVEDKGVIDAFGCRERVIELNNQKKFSTCFPPGYDETQACTKITEAWFNPVAGSDRASCFAGRTKEGMLIRICLQRDLRTSEIYVATAFPISQEKLLTEYLIQKKI